MPVFYELGSSPEGLTRAWAQGRTPDGWVTTSSGAQYRPMLPIAALRSVLPEVASNQAELPVRGDAAIRAAGEIGIANS